MITKPVVFLGSEGELGVVAKNFHDYLWLLASGHGAYETIAYPDDETPTNSQFMDFAKKHSLSNQQKASSIIQEARAMYPDFAKNIESLCQY